MIRKMYYEDLPRRGKLIYWKDVIGYNVKFIYGKIKGEIKIIDYDGKHLYIKYLDKVHKTTIGCFRDCQIGKVLGKRTGKFQVEIGSIIKDSKRDMTIIDKEFRLDNKNCNWKWYKYKCNICGWDQGWIVENALLNDTGCSCCSCRTVVEGINDIPTTTPWMVKFFQGGYDEAKLYTKSSDKKIFPICPDCGRISKRKSIITNIYNRHLISCICGDGMSYPNKFCYMLLEQLGIKFKTEYSPDWIKPRKYDFYFELDNKKYIVEMDGGWHNTNNTRNGQSKEKSKEIDNYKNIKAKENNVEIIRINCSKSELEYIKNNVLNSYLSKLFDLYKINWIELEESILKSLVKEVCEYKRDNPNMSTVEIGNIFNLCHATIGNYLKKGDNIWGWCTYDPKEEKIRTGRKSGLMSGKQVEIFKNNISLGTFKNIIELERNSLELFGVKLLNSNISAVCNNKRPHHKGYTFKHI